MIESLIFSEACLSCRGCCRFAEQHSIWSPLFLYEEIQKLVNEDIVPSCLFSHGGLSAKTATRMASVEIDGQLYCPCLDVKANACKIYPHRPLDCRLYPFLLLKKDGKAYLAFDLKCPLAQDLHQAEALAAFSRELIKSLSTPEFKQMVQRNPGIVQTYPGDFKILAPLFFD